MSTIDLLAYVQAIYMGKRRVAKFGVPALKRFIVESPIQQKVHYTLETRKGLFLLRILFIRKCSNVTSSYKLDQYFFRNRFRFSVIAFFLTKYVIFFSG